MSEANPFDQFDQYQNKPGGPPAAAGSNGNPFDQFDQFGKKPDTPAATNDLDPLQGAAALGDVAMTAGSHAASAMVGGVAGLGARAIGADPEKAKAWVSALMNWDPHTEEGKAFFDAAGKAVDSVAGPVKRGMAKLNEETDSPLMRQAGGLASQITDTLGDAATALPVAGAAMEGVGAMRAASAASKLPTNPVVGELRQRGIMLRPSDVAKMTPGAKPGALAKGLELSMGSAETARELSTYNMPIFQESAARAAGIDLTKYHGVMPERAFEAAKAPYHAVYQEMAALPDPGTDLGYSGDVAKISTRGMGREAAADVEKLKQDFSEVTTSQSAVNDVLALRKKASRLFQSDVPGSDEVAHALRAIANSIDTELSRRAMIAARNTGDYQLADRFNAARMQLSKIHAVEDSTRAGIIDPKLILKAKKGGVPVHLDDDLNFIATAAEHAPEVSRHPMSYRNADAGGIPSAADLIIHPMQAVARNVGGRAVLHGPYQRALGEKGIVAKPQKIKTPGKAVARVDKEKYKPQTPATPIGRMMPPDEGQAPRGSTPGLPARVPGKDYTPAAPRGRSTPFIDDGRPRSAVNHPAHPHLDSSAVPPPYQSWESKRDRITHILDVLESKYGKRYGEESGD
jgi:hypothetical protein